MSAPSSVTTNPHVPLILKSGEKTGNALIVNMIAVAIIFVIGIAAGITVGFGLTVLTANPAIGGIIGGIVSIALAATLLALWKNYGPYKTTI